MDKSSPVDCQVSFQNSHGEDLRATVVHLSRHSMTFEIYHPVFPLRVSEVLKDTRIQLGDRRLYAGRAVVNHIIKTGTIGICEAGLEDAWLDVEFQGAANLAEQLPGQFNRFIREWENDYRISSDYKLVVADMQSFFGELRSWLEQVELGIRSEPAGGVARLECQVLDQLASSVLPCIDALFDRFEAVAGRIERAAEAAHRKYMRRLLHPLVMCAPFAYRTFEKPLGYAGDYEMVNMMIRPPYEGSSLYAKMLNLWFLRQMPAQAHRNRIELLKTRLRDETMRVARMYSRPARVFNLGCGPAAELQSFFADNGVNPLPHVTLVDFNEETLHYVRDTFTRLAASSAKAFPLHFQKRSVHSILKEAARTIDQPLDKQFDLIYCAGLFDYLSDSVCQKLLGILYTWVAPGGLLLTTNVDPSNPIKKGMEHLLDWNLLYRNSRQAVALRPSGVSEDSFSVVSEQTGVNNLIQIRKPLDG